MKTISTLVWFAFICVGCADKQGAAVRAKSGRFDVTQTFQGNPVETVRFHHPDHPPVTLEPYPWQAIYSLSPDDQWLFRTQKIGSGESTAILYQMEKTGKVTQVQGFDDLLWATSDKTSRLKRNELYHTGIADVARAKDSSSVEIVLRGTNASVNGAGLRTRLTYDLKSHKAALAPSQKDR